jgi:hypothetical protein
MNRFKISLILAIIIPLIGISSAFSQGPEYTFNLSDMFPIQDFEVGSENGLVVKALDKEGNIDTNIEGIYTFVINGYIEKIKFSKGVAPISSNFQSSEVLYVKHERQLNTLRHLFYSIGSWTILIPLWLFLLVPVLILLLAMFIKRLLFLLIFVAFVVFFLMQGLDISTFINLIKDALQNFAF